MTYKTDWDFDNATYKRSIHKKKTFKFGCGVGWDSRNRRSARTVRRYTYGIETPHYDQWDETMGWFDLKLADCEEALLNTDDDEKIKYIRRDIKRLKEDKQYQIDFKPENKVLYTFYYNDHDYDYIIDKVDIPEIAEKMREFKVEIDKYNASHKHPRRSAYGEMRVTPDKIDVSISWEINRYDCNTGLSYTYTHMRI